MPTVAKYDVVSDQRLTLNHGEGHAFPLETPGIRTDIRALLSYMAVPLDRVEFKILIANGKGIHHIHPSKELGSHHAGNMATGSRMLQVVIGAGVLQKSGNTLRIEVTEGQGQFSDIMLWYQTDV